MKELLSVVESAWAELSALRGYPVDKDAPVCIHVGRLVQKRIPGSRLLRMQVPERDDFEAVVVATVEGRVSVIDPAHLVWRKRKLRQPPNVQEATLVVPIERSFYPRTHIPGATRLQKPYVSALTRLISELSNASTR